MVKAPKNSYLLDKLMKASIIIIIQKNFLSSKIKKEKEDEDEEDRRRGRRKKNKEEKKNKNKMMIDG